MSAIHYKFRSALEYKTLTFEGLQITVSELKRLIYENEKISRSADFDLQIINAQTKMSYDDDNTMVPRNASVIIARVPASNPQKLPKVWDKSTEGVVQRSRVNDAHKSFGSSNTLLERVDLTKKTDLTEEEKLKEMGRLATRDYDPSNFARRRAVVSGPAPINYVCSRCNQTGHWISNCPLLNIRRTTGIPKDELIETTPDDPQAMLTPGGTFAVSILHKAAKLVGKKERPPFVTDDSFETGEKLGYSQLKPPAPPELVCKLCGELLRDAVLIKCCCMSFCDECVRGCLLESDRHECPYCHALDIDPDSLLPNAQLRQAVNSYRNDSGYTYVSSTSRLASLSTPPSTSSQSQTSSTTSQRSLAPESTRSLTGVVVHTQTASTVATGLSTSRSHQEIPYERVPVSSQIQPRGSYISPQTSTFTGPLHSKVDLTVNLQSQSQPKIATPPYPFSTGALQSAKPSTGSAGSVTVIPPSFGASYPPSHGLPPPNAIIPAETAVISPAAVILPPSSASAVVQAPPHVVVQSAPHPIVQYAALPSQHQPPPPGVSSGMASFALKSGRLKPLQFGRQLLCSSSQRRPKKRKKISVSFTQQKSALLLPQHRPLTEEEFYMEKQRLLQKMKPKDEWEEFLERKDRNKRRESRSPSSSSYESSISRRSSKSPSRSRSIEKRRDRRRTVGHHRYRRSRSRELSRRRRHRRHSRSPYGGNRSYSRSPSGYSNRHRRSPSISDNRHRMSPLLSSLTYRDFRSRNHVTTTRFGGGTTSSAAALQASFLSSLGHQPLTSVVPSPFATTWFPGAPYNTAPPLTSTSSSLASTLCPPGVDAAFAKSRFEYETSAVAPPLMSMATSERHISSAEKQSTSKQSTSIEAELRRKKSKYGSTEKAAPGKSSGFEEKRELSVDKVDRKRGTYRSEKCRSKTKRELSDSDATARRRKKESAVRRQSQTDVKSGDEEKVHEDEEHKRSRRKVSSKKDRKEHHVNKAEVGDPEDISETIAESATLRALDMPNVPLAPKPRKISIELKADRKTNERLLETELKSELVPRRASTPPSGVRASKQLPISLSPTIIFKPLEIVASRVNYKKPAEAMRKPSETSGKDEILERNLESGENLVELKDSVDSNLEMDDRDEQESTKSAKKKAKKEKKKHKKKHHKRHRSLKSPTKDDDRHGDVTSIKSRHIEEEITEQVDNMDVEITDDKLLTKRKRHKSHKKGKKKHREKTESSPTGLAGNDKRSSTIEEGRRKSVKLHKSSRTESR